MRGECSCVSADVVAPGLELDAMERGCDVVFALVDEVVELE